MPTTFQDDIIYVSRSNRLSAGIMATVFLLIAVAAAGYGLIFLASVTKEILVAVIAASASLFSVVFSYAFQRAKDVELAAIQKRRELELAERKIKQDNYTRILERLALFVRNPKSTDEFITAYLHTTVVGSMDVVECTHAFLKSRTAVSLDKLLFAMRNDLALGMTNNLIETAGLFPDQPAPGNLG